MNPMYMPSICIPLLFQHALTRPNKRDHEIRNQRIKVMKMKAKSAAKVKQMETRIKTSSAKEETKVE